MSVLGAQGGCSGISGETAPLYCLRVTNLRIPWEKSCDKDNRKLELTGREWSKHPTAVSHASIPTVHDSNNEKAQMQMKESHAWLVLPPAGKDVSVGWMQLILLQVPGFKELQALLHRQAFLQTLGPDVSELPGNTGSVFLQEVRIAFRFHYVVS